MSEREPERLEGRREKQEGEGMKWACGKTGRRENKKKFGKAALMGGAGQGEEA